jgi:hypothetical protein
MVSVSEVLSTRAKTTVEDGSCHGMMARTKEEEGDSRKMHMGLLLVVGITASRAARKMHMGPLPVGTWDHGLLGSSYARQQYEALRSLPGLQFRAPGTVLSCGRFIYVTCAYVII